MKFLFCAIIFFFVIIANGLNVYAENSNLMINEYDRSAKNSGESISEYYPKVQSFPKIIPLSEAVKFDQVDFIFSEIKIKDSEWGRLTAYPEILTKISQTPRGFLNVYTDNGWVVRNFYVNQNNKLDSVTTYFDLGTPRQKDVQSISARLEFSSMPQTNFDDGERFDYPVGTKIWSAAGAGDASPKGIGPPPIPPSDLPQITAPDPSTIPPLDPRTKTPSVNSSPRPTFLVGSPPAVMTIQATASTTDSGEFHTLSNISNVETALNQCFPMAIANSLEYLKDSFGLNISHDHIKGLKGDETLVGQLDEEMNRQVSSRTSGAGVWFDDMFNGKFSYLNNNGLKDNLIHVHQGRGYGDGELPDADYVAHGITSKYQGSPVSFDWICAEIQKGSDVELVFRFSGGGGHAVRVFECGKISGKNSLGIVHDRNQLNDTDGLENVRLDVLSDNDTLYLGTPNWEIVFALSESKSMEIPEWLKNTARWWSQDTIGDSEFVSAIQYLINEGIMRIPPTTPGSDNGTSEIPDWIKNNAGWWADDLITDWDFVLGIQWLIENGIIVI